MYECPSVSDHPIFIAGSGRCGSTFVQTALCGVGDVWIWGEHAGILEGIFSWCKSVRGDQLLSAAVYPQSDIDPPQLLRETDNEMVAAWLNGFSRSTIDRIEANIITDLFVKPLPPGKRRWGFKEIRYGATDLTTLRLLELFPSGKILHIVRDPFSTVESSMIAWWKELPDVLAAHDYERLKREYRTLLGNWIQITSGYLELEEARPSIVKTFRIEDGESALRQIAQFVQVDECGLLQASRDRARRNRSRLKLGRDVEGPDAIFQACRLEFAPMVPHLLKRLGYGSNPPGGVLSVH